MGSSHAYTEDTQTNWNGIIGKMYLEAKESPVIIKRLLTHSHAAENSVDVEITLCGNLKKKYSISTAITGKDGYASQQSFLNEGNSKKLVNVDGTTTLRYKIHLGSDARKWSEFSPQNLLTLNVRIECEGKSDEKVTTFGLCDFRAENSHFIVNGNKTFLRGRSEERRVGKSVDLGGRRIIKKKNFFQAEDGIRDIRLSDWSSDVCSSDLR